MFHLIASGVSPSYDMGNAGVPMAPTDVRTVFERRRSRDDRGFKPAHETAVQEAVGLDAERGWSSFGGTGMLAKGLKIKAQAVQEATLTAGF